jgi:hypothetical protein
VNLEMQSQFGVRNTCPTKLAKKCFGESKQETWQNILDHNITSIYQPERCYNLINYSFCLIHFATYSVSVIMYQHYDLRYRSVHINSVQCLLYIPESNINIGTGYFLYTCLKLIYIPYTIEGFTAVKMHDIKRDNTLCKTG